jgi:magnesium transporter
LSDTGLAFAAGLLRAHPETAAAVLEAQPTPAAAAVLQELPAELGAPVVARMLPAPASRCLLRMAPDDAAAIVRAMPPAAAAPLLRAWPQQRRDPLLAMLPQRSAFAIRLLLGFPGTSVGAWMDPEPPLLPDDCDAAAALDRLRSEARDIDRLVFVVDREQRLRGRVRTAELLRAAPDTPVATLMEPADATLQARDDLHGHRDNPAWTAGEALAVLARDGRVIGALHHADLARGLAAARPATEGVLGDPALDVADAYWLGLARLVEGLIGMIPAGSPAAHRPRRDDAPAGSP